MRWRNVYERGVALIVAPLEINMVRTSRRETLVNLIDVLDRKEFGRRSRHAGVVKLLRGP